MSGWSQRVAAAERGVWGGEAPLFFEKTVKSQWLIEAFGAARRWFSAWIGRGVAVAKWHVWGGERGRSGGREVGDSLVGVAVAE